MLAPLGGACRSLSGLVVVSWGEQCLQVFEKGGFLCFVGVLVDGLKGFGFECFGGQFIGEFLDSSSLVFHMHHQGALHHFLCCC